MKQGILIFIGGTFILLVFGVWVYLLIFGTPENVKDVFTDLGASTQELPDREAVTLPTEVTQTINIGNTPLSQITTRPVAGFAFVESASSTEHIRYAERGVGHVYDIDITTGVETRVLGKTFAAITNAIFNPEASAVVLVAEDGYQTTAYIETITESESSEVHSIPADAENIAFTTNTDLRYTRKTEGGTVGYAYDLTEQQTFQLFSIPLRDVTVIWKGDETLVYSKPAPYLLGALYRIENDALVRIGDTAYGLSGLAHPFDAATVRTGIDLETKTLVSSYATAADNWTPIAVATIPEKCTFDLIENETLWCAAPAELISRTFQTDWYKGVVASHDILWEIDLDEGTAALSVHFLAETGRIVDIDRIMTDRFGSYLLFRNKVDGALWLYNPTLE